jgi:hypothetical protein
MAKRQERRKKRQENKGKENTRKTGRKEKDMKIDNENKKENMTIKFRDPLVTLALLFPLPLSLSVPIFFFL